MSAEPPETSDNIIVYGDPQNYLIYDRVGEMTEFVPGLHKPTSPAVRRWLTHWRRGAESIGEHTAPDTDEAGEDTDGA